MNLILSLEYRRLAKKQSLLGPLLSSSGKYPVSEQSNPQVWRVIASLYSFLKTCITAVTSTFANSRSHQARSSRLERLIDRYIGPLLLLCFRALRPRRIIPHSPQRIAISVLGAIGDAIVASAIAKDVKARFPDAQVILLASNTNKAVGSLLSVFDKVFVLPIVRSDIAIRRLRSAKFDLLIDCNQWLRISAIQAAFANCATIGFRTRGQRRHYSYDYIVDHLGTRHEIENFRALLAPLGIPAVETPEVSIKIEAFGAVESILNDLSKRSSEIAIFHPWAGGANADLKEWPQQSWVALAEHLDQRGLTLCITGSPADMPKSQQLATAAASKGVRLEVLAGRLSLEETAAMVSMATVVVTVNTGIMHLAAALTSRLVTLHGPTNPVRWGPLNNKALALVPHGINSGYLNLGFEFPRNGGECMSFISVDQVITAVQRVLNTCESCRGEIG